MRSPERREAETLEQRKAADCQGDAEQRRGQERQYRLRQDVPFDEIDRPSALLNPAQRIVGQRPPLIIDGERERRQLDRVEDREDGEEEEEARKSEQRQAP